MAGMPVQIVYVQTVAVHSEFIRSAVGEPLSTVQNIQTI
jgi:hypothetical protein